MNRRSYGLLATLAIALTACGSEIQVSIEHEAHASPASTKMVIEDGKWVQKFEVCARTIRVENNSEHRIRFISGPGFDYFNIGSGEVLDDRIELTGDASCESYEDLEPRLDQCEIDGVPEGECKAMVGISIS